MNCYTYWRKIKKIAKNLKEYDLDQIQKIPPVEVQKILDSIEKIAHDPQIDQKSAEYILKQKEIQEPLKLIRRFFLEVGESREMDKAQEVLQSPDPWLTIRSFHFYKRYLELIQNENQLINFNPSIKVAFVGGGPLPLTPIFLNILYGVRSSSIEIIPDVALLSEKVIRRLDLTAQIKVVTGNETSLEDLDFDMVMIAALAEPKERVFKNIRNQVDDSIPIIYRTYTGMRAIRYTPTNKEVLNGFRTVNIIEPAGKVNNTSVLIMKET